MGRSFRRSLKFGPLRVNVSKSGVGVSAGVRGARVAVGPRGTYVSFGVGGFRYQQKLSDSKRRGAGGAPPMPGPNVPASPISGEIVTASAEALAQVAPDAALEEVRKRITRTNLFKLYAWAAGFVSLWMIASSLFLLWLVTVVVAGVVLYRWDRERRTARIFYDVDNEEIVGRLALCNAAGESLAKARALWRVHSSASTTQQKYHAGANTLIQRHPTRCVAGSLKGIELNIEPWAITVGAQEFLLLPDRLVVREGKHLAGVPYEWLSPAQIRAYVIADNKLAENAGWDRALLALELEELSVDPNSPVNAPTASGGILMPWKRPLWP